MERKLVFIREQGERDLHSSDTRKHKSHLSMESFDESISDLGMSSNAHQNNQPIESFDINAVQLLEEQYTIDNNLVKTSEYKDNLRIRSPRFRLFCRLMIPPIPKGVEICVGFVQYCTEYKLIHKYGDAGIASREIPELVSGGDKIVNDTNKVFPLLKGLGNEGMVITGPVDKQHTISLHTDSCIDEKVSWCIPGEEKEPELTFVYSKQSYQTFIFILAKDGSGRKVLNKFKWSLELAIDVDPREQLGNRSTFIGPYKQEAVEKVSPTKCKNYPNKKDEECFIWRPTKGEPKILKSSEKSSIDDYDLQDSFYVTNLFKLTKRHFLLKQKEKKKRGEF